MIIRWTLWAYLLGSQHKLICWNSIKYNDSQQVPGEIQTEDYMHIHVYPQQQHIVHGYTILACQKSLLYSLCAAGLSSNSSSDISRFTWKRVHGHGHVTDSQTCTYLSLSGYLVSSHSYLAAAGQFPGPTQLFGACLQMEDGPGNEVTEPDVWGNVLQPNSSTLVESFTIKLTGNGFESYLQFSSISISLSSLSSSISVSPWDPSIWLRVGRAAGAAK